MPFGGCTTVTFVVFFLLLINIMMLCKDNKPDKINKTGSLMFS